uniref:ATG7_N domain-containing protein n=1 Tax=Heligmosomoides polygyrus TaxID=6339 RepID=A0A183GNF3_HELPZ
LSHESFDTGSPGTYHGRLILLNTLENFKGMDRKALLSDEAEKVSPFVEDGRLMRYFNETKAFAFLLDSSGKCVPLHSLQSVTDPSNVKVVFVDPSPVADCAGWPLRNLVAAVAYLKTSWTWCSFVALKGGSDLKEYKISWKQTEINRVPASVGWERNHQGKMVPQFADLRKQFDPKKLMEQSVGLNLSLIKWRLVPDMNLERYTSLKVGAEFSPY